MAVRMPRRIQGVPFSRGCYLALRDHTSVCFASEAISAPRTRLCDRS